MDVESWEKREQPPIGRAPNLAAIARERLWSTPFVQPQTVPALAASFPLMAHWHNQRRSFVGASPLDITWNIVRLIEPGNWEEAGRGFCKPTNRGFYHPELQTAFVLHDQLPGSSPNHIVYEVAHEIGHAAAPLDARFHHLREGVADNETRDMLNGFVFPNMFGVAGNQTRLNAIHHIRLSLTNENGKLLTKDDFLEVASGYDPIALHYPDAARFVKALTAVLSNSQRRQFWLSVLEADSDGLTTMLEARFGSTFAERVSGGHEVSLNGCIEAAPEIKAHIEATLSLNYEQNLSF